MQTTLYPTHSFKGRTRATPLPRRAPARPAGRPGDWRYDGLPRPPRIPWLALVVSAGLHAFGLLGFNQGVHPVKAVVREDAVIQMVMPDLKDDEEPPLADLEDAAEEPPGIVVPTLMDIPTHLDMADAFVQPLQQNVPVQTDLRGMKLSSIPVRIAQGPRSASGLKNIFDLSQLDRVPQAIVQPAPRFPYELTKVVSEAEVVVEFIVDTAGNVREATIVSSTLRGFEQSTLDAVGKWRFRPGMKGGRKVNTRIRQPVRFSVTEGG